MKTFVFLLGWIFLGFGVIGVFLPLLPTTPFLLLAVWCFYKSSPKTHAWIENHPHFGPILRDWRLRGAISHKTKILAMIMILISLTGIWLRVDQRWLQILITLLLLCVSTFILTRPSD